jgi:hypothetical protein
MVNVTVGVDVYYKGNGKDSIFFNMIFLVTIGDQLSRNSSIDNDERENREERSHGHGFWRDWTFLCDDSEI